MNRTLPCTILYQRAVEQLWIKRVILGECVDVFFVCWHLIGWLRTHYTRFSTWIDGDMLFPAILLASSSCTVFTSVIEGKVEHQPGGGNPPAGGWRRIDTSRLYRETRPILVFSECIWLLRGQSSCYRLTTNHFPVFLFALAIEQTHLFLNASFKKWRAQELPNALHSTKLRRLYKLNLTRLLWCFFVTTAMKIEINLVLTMISPWRVPLIIAD